MPKLPNLTSKGLIKRLKKVGFELDHTTGSHYIYRNLKTLKRAVVPYHIKNLPKGTFLSILKEAGLSKEDII